MCLANLIPKTFPQVLWQNDYRIQNEIKHFRKSAAQYPTNYDRKQQCPVIFRAWKAAIYQVDTWSQVINE